MIPTIPKKAKQFRIIHNKTIMADHHLAYKKALKEKYELEKSGDNASFLIQPTPGKLRDLTIAILSRSTDQNDHTIFHNFMGFAFDNNQLQKLHNKIDAYRPLVKFLNDKSDLAHYKSVEMLALLVDFKPRPYNAYNKKREQLQPASVTAATPVAEKEDNCKEEPLKDVTDNLQQDHTEKEVFLTASTLPATIIRQKETIPKGLEISAKKPNKRKFVTAGIGLGTLLLGGSLFYNVQLSNQKNCMQWSHDHYIAVDCNETTYTGFLNTTLPINESLVKNFRKLEVDSNTQFFDAQDNPLVWYHKDRAGNIEYYNQPGLHPETGHTLKKITPYMIDKYVKAK